MDTILAELSVALVAAERTDQLLKRVNLDYEECFEWLDEDRHPDALAAVPLSAPNNAVISISTSVKASQLLHISGADNRPTVEAAEDPLAVILRMARDIRLADSQRQVFFKPAQHLPIVCLLAFELQLIIWKS